MLRKKVRQSLAVCRAGLQLGLHARLLQQRLQLAAVLGCHRVVAAPQVQPANEHLRMMQRWMGALPATVAGGGWRMGGLHRERWQRELVHAQVSLPAAPVATHNRLAPTADPQQSHPAATCPPTLACGTVRRPVSAWMASCTCAPSARSSSSTTLAATPSPWNRDLTSVQSAAVCVDEWRGQAIRGRNEQAGQWQTREGRWSAG